MDHVGIFFIAAVEIVHRVVAAADAVSEPIRAVAAVEFVIARRAVERTAAGTRAQAVVIIVADDLQLFRPSPRRHRLDPTVVIRSVEHVLAVCVRHDHRLFVCSQTQAVRQCIREKLSAVFVDDRDRSARICQDQFARADRQRRRRADLIEILFSDLAVIAREHDHVFRALERCAVIVNRIATAPDAVQKHVRRFVIRIAVEFVVAVCAVERRSARARADHVGIAVADDQQLALAVSRRVDRFKLVAVIRRVDRRVFIAVRDHQELVTCQ